MKGYVHVYTGDGKGKTTAAFGLALRAVGAGMKVYIAQFVKGMEYSELKAIEKFSGQIRLKQFGRDCFIQREPEEADIKAAREGLEEVRKVLQSGEYQMVILDEANIATFYKLFSVDELLELIDNKTEDVFVLVGLGSTLVLAANPNRVDAELVNDGDDTIYLARGDAAVVGSGIRLNPNGGSYSIGTVNLFEGEVYGISENETNLTVSEGVKP